MATPTVVRDSGLAPMNVPGGVISDCGIRAQLVNDPATGHVYSRGYASCSTAKRGIMVETSPPVRPAKFLDHCAF
jgi:hypothetical protein